jgi:ABC-type transport system involved in multi-copper enzyme maturation permease subunit
VNLDIVDGALAGAKLFGRSLEISDSRIDLDKLVLGFESGFSAFLYLVGTFLAIFATAHLVPRLQEKGTVDLYLSRPVGRISLLLSRYAAGLLLAGVNLAYLIGSIWAIVFWKTGVAHPRFLLGGAVILFAISALLSFAFLVGVVTSSTGVSIMATYGVFFFSALLAGHERIAAAVSKQWQVIVVNGLYWIFPKTAEMGQAVVALVSGGQGPARLQQSFTWLPFATTAAFALTCIGLASFLFWRKDF